jgi:PKD repeat protein
MCRPRWSPFAPLPGLLAVTLLAAGCRDSVAPEHHDPGVPAFLEVGTQSALRGLGTLGTGEPTPGSDLQEFDFDVAADLTGRVRYRDWVFDATLTVDASDPETEITAFRDGADACAEPAQGAAFDAIGRRETGELLGFSVIACDHGAAGSGADGFLLTTVSYSKGGLLSSGDIVKTVTESSQMTGALTITTATTGTDFPPHYTLNASGPQSGSQAIAANTTVTFSGITPGDYTLELSDVPANCTVSGTNRRTVTVPAGGTGGTRFDVRCTATTGDLRVTGLGHVGDGLAQPGMDRLEFDFEVTNALSGRVVVTDYSVVRSDGSAGRMTVDPATDPETGITNFSRTSATCVRFGGVGRLNDADRLFDFFIDACDNASPGAGADAFAVTLPARPYSNGGTLTEGDIVTSTADPAPPTGGLTIATATTGESPPAGYTLSATTPDGTSTTLTFGATDSQTFTGIAAGDYTLEINDVPDNCTVVNGTNPRTVAVPDGGSVSTAFEVSCAATPPPPVANFTFSCSGLTCSFDASSSTAQATATYSCTWGDGTPPGSGKTATHTYGAAGSYTVTLTVTDGGGSSTTTQTVTVSAPNQAPILNAGADETVLLGVLYTLSASFSDPDNGPWSYTISWGDGSSTSGTKSSQATISATHHYLLIGSYTIKVTVVDSRGASGWDTKVLTVFTSLGGIL